uniref:Unassigned protein n=1 Tax=Fusarium culmorum CS7071 TaxID=1318462 RepID=A0A060QRJ0_FUSCU|nr:Unassigned protein [Fusarium culmorum CS7071]
MLWNCGFHEINVIPGFIFFIYDKAFSPGNLERKRGQRQVIMALILWAIDVPHIPKQRDAKMWI